MAYLKNITSGQRVVLRSRNTVGRSPGADTTLQTSRVSGEHAVFTWTGDQWELRDLGSTNGTWLGARQVEAGERAPLKVGNRVGFGDPGDPWLVQSIAPPSVIAWCGDELVEGDGPFLALPSLEDPQVVIEDEEAAWVIVQNEERRPITDRERIVVAGRSWEIGLPASLAPTAPLGTLERIQTLRERSLNTARIEFAVSGDEEYVEVTAHIAGEAHSIPPKAHHYLLLLLARARVEDAESGQTPSEHGWLYTSDLRKMLRCESNQFYVMCHRNRKEFAKLEVTNAANIIERRTTSRQIRIGVAALSERAL
ncbi:MAG: FHA domain-containing protein [Deltaproteobacteria bacterium]|nr:FHA domain-containing protein [Deltaproteobacteria bacterium]